MLFVKAPIAYIFLGCIFLQHFNILFSQILTTCMIWYLCAWSLPCPRTFKVLYKWLASKVIIIHLDFLNMLLADKGESTTSSYTAVTSSTGSFASQSSEKTTLCYMPGHSRKECIGFKILSIREEGKRKTISEGAAPSYILSCLLPVQTSTFPRLVCFPFFEGTREVAPASIVTLPGRYDIQGRVQSFLSTASCYQPEGEGRSQLGVPCKCDIPNVQWTNPLAWFASCRSICKFGLAPPPFKYPDEHTYWLHFFPRFYNRASKFWECDCSRRENPPLWWTSFNGIWQVR